MSVLSVAQVPVDVWLALGYSLGMLGLAYVIDGFARRAAAVVEGGKLSGFTYHPDADAWTCREGQWLRPHTFDAANSVLRYRADADACNACPRKFACTTATTGREVQRAVESWPASEAARFHRRIACVVVVLGLMWPAALLVGGPGISGALVLVTGIAVIAVLSLPLWSHLWRAKTYIPEEMLLHGADGSPRGDGVPDPSQLPVSQHGGRDQR